MPETNGIRWHLAHPAEATPAVRAWLDVVQEQIAAELGAVTVVAYGFLVDDGSPQE